MGGDLAGLWGLYGGARKPRKKGDFEEARNRTPTFFILLNSAVNHA